MTFNLCYYFNMKKIDEKIERVYNFTVDFIDSNGYPPSVREICASLDIKSTATAYSYLEKLKQRGLLEKSPLKKRSIALSKRNNFRSIPIIGIVRAGAPIFAVENLEGYCPLPDNMGFDDNAFALSVQGDSMIKAGIKENDLIIVNKQDTAVNGEIVVALTDDETATVKRFYKRDDKIVLHPENDEMSDMVFDNVTILGVVKGLVRKL